MQELRFFGHFCNVDCYTDGTFKINPPNFMDRESYIESYFSFDIKFIKVKIIKDIFKKYEKLIMSGLPLVIKGYLEVEVCRGTGIYSHYIMVTEIKEDMTFKEV